ncbi:hypothetical protein KA107_03755 [Candidatus Pacearchaeota archaeon]|nr:hypothetical protein [Candidatus Pacearchaeota archaeon]
MSLNTKLSSEIGPSSSLTNLDVLAEQVKKAKKEPERSNDNYPNYPALDPEELELKAKEFETKFKTCSSKREVMDMFRELPAHCQYYITKTMPYQMYWRAARMSF